MAEVRRVALVTGGAKRVGRAIVQALAEAHFDIAFTYLTSDAEAQSLAAVLASRLAKALPIKVDLTQSETAVAEVGQAFARQFSRLDVLVNSASIFPPAKLAETDSALIDRVINLHVKTPLLLCKHFAPMLRLSQGHVVNMVDLLAEKPWPAYMAYCASKAALANLTLSLARELAPQVTVNGIAPGVIEFPAHASEDEKQKYLSRVPLDRSGTPQDAARLVKFLVTEGTYITGQIIRLDGGRSLI